MGRPVPWRLFQIVKALVSSNAPGFVTGILCALVIRYYAALVHAARKRRLLPHAAQAAAASRCALSKQVGGRAIDIATRQGISDVAGGPAGDAGCLDLRRKAQIAWGKATDHAGEVVITPSPSFDLNRTIFGNLQGASTRLVVKAKIGVDLYWSDDAAERIQLAHAVVPRPPAHGQAMLDFIHQDCNFMMEHADGSFLDHLRFCYEYSAAHYKAHSPRVLFLHSIMGVGTNFFPMEEHHIPTLKGLCTDFEFLHIQAFPSILRPLNDHQLLEELNSIPPERISELKCIKYHRVMGNVPLSMDAADLWIQLNYQLMHLLDFIPASNWRAQMDDSLFQVFLPLHRLLSRLGKLEATLDLNLTEGTAECREGLPLTLGTVITCIIPSKVKRILHRKAIRQYSETIGHSLDYTLHW